ncbi:MAG: GDP-mannose 4,6-dehydratase, partial [Caldisphaeraceae archaeon]|nr:GDP-mannose 4,6-dehydratase [Caldisphaeraceae archaeon]
MVYIITGGAGFIGSKIANSLGDVIVIDNLENGKASNLKKDVKLVIGDVSDYKNLKFLETIKGEEVNIFHLAAISNANVSRLNPLKAVKVNIMGTENVLELSRVLDAYFVFASSAAVYGEKTALPIREDSKKEPINLYGYTKSLGEELLESYVKEYGIKASSLRLFNVYGEGVKGEENANVVESFARKLMRGERPVIFGDGTNTRDFVYVDDVVNSFIAISSKKITGTFNIGSGKETSIRELLELIEKAMGKAIDPVFKEARKNDIKRSVADISKAKEVLNWSPKVKLEDCLLYTSDA